MSLPVVSLLLAACVLTVSGGPTPDGPTQTSFLPNLNQIPESVKTTLNNVGINEEMVKQIQNDPQTSLLSAMAHLQKFGQRASKDAMESLSKTTSDLVKTGKNLANEHAKTLNNYVGTASEAARKVSESTRELINSDLRNFGFSANVKLPSGGFTGFGI